MWSSRFDCMILVQFRSMSTEIPDEFSEPQSCLNASSCIEAIVPQLDSGSTAAPHGFTGSASRSLPQRSAIICRHSLCTSTIPFEIPGQHPTLTFLHAGQSARCLHTSDNETAPAPTGACKKAIGRCACLGAAHGATSTYKEATSNAIMTWRRG